MTLNLVEDDDAPDGFISVGVNYDPEAERKNRERLAGVRLPVMFSTDLGSVEVVVRERDEWGGNQNASSLPVIAIETFIRNQRRDVLNLALKDVELIHAALGHYLASLIPGDPLLRKLP